MPEERLIGFDYGTKRIGVAVGQTLLGTATPLTQLAVKKGRPEKSAIQDLLDEWRPDAFVVGLPLNMDETPSKTSKAAEKFARWLEAEFGLPVHLIDERLSSREARERLEQPGKKYSKEQLNSVAAQVILEGYLQQRS